MQLRKRKKILTAGLALLVLLAAAYLFNSFSRSKNEFDEALYVKQIKLAKYRQKVLEKKAVNRELLNLQSALKVARATLLTGQTPSLAAAEIQEIVTKITKTAGVQILTVRILPPDRNGKDLYLAIPVEITINSSMRQLTGLLYQLDRSTKLLRITKLDIRSGAGRFRKRSRNGASANITSTLRVEGFVKQLET